MFLCSGWRQMTACQTTCSSRRKRGGFERRRSPPGGSRAPPAIGATPPTTASSRPSPVRTLTSLTRYLASSLVNLCCPRSYDRGPSDLWTSCRLLDPSAPLDPGTNDTCNRKLDSRSYLKCSIENFYTFTCRFLDSSKAENVLLFCSI